MKRIVLFLSGALVLATPALAAGMLPEMNVDVLVVGGTTKGVEAATRARAEGKSVYLVTPYAYLGEDLASTLELGYDEGRQPQTPFERRLWRAESDLAPYDYFPDRESEGLRWVYRNDRWARLSEAGGPPTMNDGVLYLDDVSFRCVLRKPAKVARVSVLTLGADSFRSEGILDRKDAERLARTKPNARKVATASVALTFLSGPRAGETVELERRGEPRAVPRGLAYDGGRTEVFEADVDVELSEVRLTLRIDPAAHHQLVSRLWFHLASPSEDFAPPTPLAVKRFCDRALIDAGVGFITSSPVRRVLRGPDGRLTGVEIVNRSGRRTIRAREVVDATLYGTLGKVPAVAAEETFSRIVIGDRCAPSSRGGEVGVRRLKANLTDAHSSFTGQMYRCTFSLPMADGSFPSFAAAEWAARELTQMKRTADAADVLVWHPSPRALADAQPEADELPVWGEYDVVVVGGGTAGTPAGIAAARSGARTLIVEYRDMLGGVGTDGMVLGYFDGNRCGFVAEFEEARLREKGLAHYRRAEVWRKLCRDAGVTVWFGALGLEAVREGDRVVGVEVATPLGCGIVRAKCVIDGTGNSDVAASAGAETENVAAREVTLQSAGQSPQRLGANGANSDFGYLDDADAGDLWLFGVRARAGAPNAWDLAKLPDSRERRRIVPDYRVRGEDVTAGRRYPDTIVQAKSRQDPHGLLTDDFGYLAEVSAEIVAGRREDMPMYNVNLPLRCLLPKGLVGLAVVGLGAGLERDVVTITRMQADLMNMGYGAGVAAAMAARNGGDFRAVDCAELRRRLVEKGILRPETLDWNAEDDTTSDELLAESVTTLPDGYRGGHVVYRAENRARALPLLRKAYAKATAPAARQTYALALGLMGDATGLETLVACLEGREPIQSVRADVGGAVGGKFPRAYTAGRTRDGMALALGRTRDPRGANCLAGLAAALGPEVPYGRMRPLLLACEAAGHAALASPLARLLRRDGICGYAVRDFRELPPTGGYGAGPECELCLRELAVARALLACGDHDGLGRRTLETYAKDPRALFSSHAKLVLDAQVVLNYPSCAWNCPNDKIRTKCREHLDRPFSPVTEKKQLPPSGDRHDYMSVGPYWWPDPSKPDGKPYIQRDGLINPDYKATDSSRLHGACQSVAWLAAAAWRLGDVEAGREAARRVRAFFLDERTRMNPNLNFGQAIPGRNDGRGTGIIETYGMVTSGLFDAVRILRGLGHLDARSFAGFQDWSARYLVWLETSKIGLEEAMAKNNHGTAYDLQRVILADFCGQQEKAAAILGQVAVRRMNGKIEPNGLQPLEAKRTKGISYSLFQLGMYGRLAYVGERYGVDVWGHVTPEGGSIAKAIDYIEPFCRGEKPWPYKQITPMKPDAFNFAKELREHFAGRGARGTGPGGR